VPKFSFVVSIVVEISSKLICICVSCSGT